MVKYLLFGGGAGGGKAQPYGSLVSTPFGFRKIEDLKCGDRVSNPDGKDSMVIATHEQGFVKTFLISFSDRTQTEATGDHLWVAWKDGQPQRERVYTTDEIRTELNKGFRFRIPCLSKPIQYTRPSPYGHIFQKIPPYVLGALLGDGGLTQSTPVITTADPEIIETFQSLLPEYRISKLKAILDRCGQNFFWYFLKFRFRI